MHSQSALCFSIGSRSGSHPRSCALLALTMASLLCWPMLCAAQMVAPTPQPPGVPVTAEQAAEVEIENWAVHGQSTFTWMLQPAFHAPYTGPQSLHPGANGRDTFDATLYAGFRPWPGRNLDQSGSRSRLRPEQYLWCRRLPKRRGLQTRQS